VAEKWPEGDDFAQHGSSAIRPIEISVGPEGSAGARRLPKRSGS
jgi:hypothetical protein